MSQNQGHTIEEHAFQLRYFIKRIVDNDAWMTACRMLDDLLTYPTKDGVAEIWEFVDEQEKGCSRDEVAKKPRVEQNPRKMHKPRQTRPVKKLKYPCTCGKHERFVVKATGKVLPLCPICHKAGKKEQSRVPARLAAPSAVDHAAIIGSARQKMVTAALIGSGSDLPGVLSIRNAFAELPEVVLPKTPRRRRNKADAPRCFSDRRDAGEIRAWMAKQEFKLHGKKRRGEREFAE